MGKYNLKLFNSDIKSCRVSNSDIKSEDITVLHPFIQIKQNNICISYKEYDLKMCGFLYIDKIEIYKGSYFICGRDNISNYYTEFPYFSSDGIYEIRTMFSNHDNTVSRCVISSFEFFGFKREIECDNLNLNLIHQGKNLNISLPKRIGHIDLSNIVLPDVHIFDSNDLEIKNFVSKLQVKNNEIEILILDVFNVNNVNRLVPNEVYTFKISTIGGEIYSSFSFEYENLNVELFNFVEDIYFEVLSKEKFGLLALKVFIKLSNLIDIDNYEYMICNVWGKFLYFKSSDGERNDTLVFECLIKEEKGYFELNIFNGSKLNKIIFNYDFSSEENYFISERRCGHVEYIEKDKNKYDFLFKSECDYLDGAPKFFKFQNIGEEPTNNYIEGVKLNDCEFLFKEINFLNKFSEVYVLDFGGSIAQLFVISNSIGIKFMRFDCVCRFDNTKIFLDILNDNFIHGKGLFKNGREEVFDIQHGSVELRVHNKLDNQFIYLKCYDKDNKVYRSTLSFYNNERKAFINNLIIENAYLSSSNELFIMSKSLFNDFKSDFDAMIISKNGEIISSVNISGDENFKICFKDINIRKSDLYYLRVKGGDRFKVYSMFIKPLIPKGSIYVGDLNNKGMDLFVTSFSEEFTLSMSLFIIFYGKRYMIIEGNCTFYSCSFKEKFLHKFLVKGNEYLFCFKLGKDRYYDVHFTYLGDDGEEYIYDLNHEIDI